MNGNIESSFAHWQPGDGNEPPKSAGRITLYEAYCRFYQAQTLFWTDYAEILLKDELQRPAVVVTSGSVTLGTAILQQKIQSWSRPIGGGIVERLGPALWEIDDFTERFKTSTINLMAWANNRAVATHYVFVDEIGLELFISQWLLEHQMDDDRLWASENNCIDPLHKAAPDKSALDPILRICHDERSPNRRLIRISEVKRQTSLSRTGIYDRMKAGTFPKVNKLGPKTSTWYEDEIVRWVSDQQS
jgi:prophage regulatory protein